MTDTPCRWAADGTRVLEDGTPCLRDHCPVDLATHSRLLCASCRGKIREDMTQIVSLHRWVDTMVLVAGRRGDREGGLPLGGEPMVILGPVSVFAPDDGDPNPPPLQVLVAWEYVARGILDQPTALPPNLSNAANYLWDHLEPLSAQEEFDVAWFADSIRSTRARLEDVLHAGLRAQYGVPCQKCAAHGIQGSFLVREIHPKRGLSDVWACHRCQTTLTEEEYRHHVQETYRESAPALTAEQLEERFGVKASRVRVWGSRGLVAKRGRDEAGHIQYDVAQVQARLLNTTTTEETA